MELYNRVCGISKSLFMKWFIFIVLTFTIIKNSTAQDISVEVMHFDRFDKMLQKDNDTLYIFNFWATWCKPCVEELPYFVDIDQNYKAMKVKVVLVSFDFRDALDSQLIPFIRNKEITSEVILLDEDITDLYFWKLCPEWSGAIPATMIHYGKESVFYERSFTYQELETIINQQLQH
jgi:thiol-disulfide isomerase/thioredoxin